MDIRLKYGATNPLRKLVRPGQGPSCVVDLIASVMPGAVCALTYLGPHKYTVRVLVPAGFVYANKNGREWRAEHNMDISDQFEADVVSRFEPEAVERYTMLHNNVKPKWRCSIVPGLNEDDTVPIGTEEDVLNYWCALRKRVVPEKPVQLTPSDGLVFENPLQSLGAEERQHIVKAQSCLEEVLRLLSPLRYQNEETKPTITVAVSDSPRRFRLEVDKSPAWSESGFALQLDTPTEIVGRNTAGWSTASEMASAFEEYMQKIRQISHEREEEIKFKVSDVFKTEGFVFENPRSPI